MASTRVYLSHCPEDNAWCRGFVQTLQSFGLAVWFNEQGPEAGPTWVAAQEQALRSCDMVIMIISPDALASTWVQHEAQVAMQANRLIGPVVIREAQVPPPLQEMSPLLAIGQAPPQVAQLVAGRLGAATPASAVAFNTPSAAPERAARGTPDNPSREGAGRSAYDLPSRPANSFGADPPPSPSGFLHDASPSAFNGRDQDLNGGGREMNGPPILGNVGAGQNFAAALAYSKGKRPIPFEEPEPKRNKSLAIAGSLIAAVLVLVVGIFVIRPLLKASGTSSTGTNTSTGTSTAGGNAPNSVTVKMNAAQFVGVTSVTISKGGALIFTDLADVGVAHILAMGQNGIFAANPNAPAQLNTAEGLRIEAGQTATLTFAKSGTYTITCIIHPAMNMTVVVP